MMWVDLPARCEEQFAVRFMPGQRLADPLIVRPSQREAAFAGHAKDVAD